MSQQFFANVDEAAQVESRTQSQSPDTAWGKTWHKVEGWLKKEDEEDEDASPLGSIEYENVNEKDETESRGIRQDKLLKPALPAFPQAPSYARQNSEQREKLCPYEPDPEERRACSADRKAASTYWKPSAVPQVPKPGFALSTVEGQDDGERKSCKPEEAVPQAPFTSAESQGLGLGEREDIQVENVPFLSHHDMLRDQQHLSEALDDLQIQAELETKWILNLSMHFRDNSDREKFFVTYAEEPNKWRRVTISCDYRNVPVDSLEADLKSLHYQRDKSARIYEAIRDSLGGIQFYSSVTNLKLQTSEGRLHVHVTEDVNEMIQYPPVSLLRHLDCPRFKESAIEFDSHLSGFVYKIKTNNRIFIKKEIPGPEAVDEFLYEVNALSELRGCPNVVQFEGIVMDDSNHLIKGLLLSFCEQGALVDVIYDYKDSEWLPWIRRERWAKQIVKGLSDIHEAGFVQGDFTLSNIVIDKDDAARCIDINRRGCPVGWEPPELATLIQSGQRISNYIGVKSDIFQLGMVLWALAEQHDEPERQEGPLRIKPSSGIPDYYKKIVESCLSPNPRDRRSAKDIFAQFPSLEESKRGTQHEVGICLSPHRPKKEYIDPATAVGLEDIDQLKSIANDAGHQSQFSASEATFADGAASTEYLFSSISDTVDHRGRSSIRSMDGERRRSGVAIDPDSVPLAERSRHKPMKVVDADLRLLDTSPQCIEDIMQQSIEPFLGDVKKQEKPKAAASSPENANDLSGPVAVIATPSCSPRRKSEHVDTTATLHVLNSVDRKNEQAAEVDSMFAKPFSPPVHQDSGFDEFPLPDMEVRSVLEEYDLPSTVEPIHPDLVLRSQTPV